MVIFNSYVKLPEGSGEIIKTSPLLQRSNPHDLYHRTILYLESAAASFLGTYLRSMESMVMINPEKKSPVWNEFATVKNTWTWPLPSLFRDQKYHLNLVGVSVLFLPALPTVS